ncbi:dehydrogenase [Paenibacillaceae bacterium]|nr:dehydrogenase [Paenibacillaceae bacterium]
MNPAHEKHQSDYPTARKIRRACSNELYRTIKRLKQPILPNKVAEAEKIYYRKVILNLQWIHENHSNRKLLSDWWEENVSEEIAALWEVDRTRLCDAFRNAFGG